MTIATTEDKLQSAINVIAIQTETLAVQQSVLQQQVDSIARLLSLTERQRNFITIQDKRIESLKSTIKWLHEQIQEMDAESAGLIPPRR